MIRLLVFATFSVALFSGPLAANEVWPGKNWARSTPEAEGLDPEAIEALVADLKAGAYGLVDHFLLIRNGRVVADYRFRHDYEALVDDSKNGQNRADDQYDYDHPDWHPYYRGTDLHTLQSVTKSVTSAALGIAVDAGFIKDVEIPVMPFFHAYDHDLSDTRKSAITLEDLLTMRSGIDWVTTGAYGSGNHSTDFLERSEQWIQFILDRPMETDPGTVFDYNDGVSVLIGKILREATGQRIDEWASARLFNPIGIEQFYWKITPDGEADTEGGLYLTAHDLARIGYLFLRRGEWNGRRVLSREWIEASLTPVVTGARPENDGYGYQWWIPVHEGGKAKIFAGNGYGGQRLHVSPDHDIVIVFNGWNIHRGDVKSTTGVLQERIIPALIHDGDSSL